MIFVILDDDTLSALGLKYLLRKYFDAEVKIAQDRESIDSNDSSSTVYFVTPRIYVEMVDFFFPRRQRIIVVGNGEKCQLDSFSSESDIIEHLRKIITSYELSDNSSSSELSPRENEVLRLVAMGYINKEIADKLNISINTVLSHRKNISSKLGIKSVSGLSVYAMMNGYISENDLKIL